MRSRFLFPHWARIVGYLCFLAYIPIALLEKFLKAANEYPTASFFTDHFFKMVILMLIVIGLLLVAFSKEKIEDERIAQLRLDSLQWSVYLNYAILLVCIILVNDWHFFIAIASHYIFTPLVFFIIRFRWVVYQSNKVGKEADLS
jgi:nitrate reductase gamma subunit